MVRDRSSEGVSAAYRKLVDMPEEKLIGFWVWEYVLKYTSDVSLIRELTESLPFPKDVPRLKQMILIKALSFQISKDLDIQETLKLLEALEQSFEDPQLEESDDVGLSKRFKPSSSTVNGDGSVWKGLRQPTLELREELRKLLSEEADVQNVTGIVNKLSALTKNAWALFGPVFLEKAEAAVINGNYKPQGVSIPLPLAENVGAVDDSGAKTSKENPVVELINAVNGRNETLDMARQALATSSAALEKLVNDPLPEILRKPDGGVPGVVKRSLLDPHPSAQAQVWDEEDEIEESVSPLTPSASKRICLPPLHSPNRKPVASSVAIQSSGLRDKPRRQKKKWSEEEVDILKREVQRYGKGRWKMILQKNKEVLQGRTEVDIKDKWRNLEKPHVEFGGRSPPEDVGRAEVAAEDQALNFCLAMTMATSYSRSRTDHHLFSLKSNGFLTYPPCPRETKCWWLGDITCKRHGSVLLITLKSRKQRWKVLWPNRSLLRSISNQQKRANRVPLNFVLKFNGASFPVVEVLGQDRIRLQLITPASFFRCFKVLFVDVFEHVCASYL